MDMSLLLLEFMTLVFLLASGFGLSRVPLWLQAALKKGRAQ